MKNSIRFPLSSDFVQINTSKQSHTSKDLILPSFKNRFQTEILIKKQAAAFPNRILIEKLKECQIQLMYLQLKFPTRILINIIEEFRSQLQLHF